jgi:hypothetical protein
MVQFRREEMDYWERYDPVRNPFPSPTLLFDTFQLLKFESERSNYASS